jgi:transcriptional regulator with XRE-family HTH domain
MNRDVFFPEGMQFDQESELEFAREELIYNVTRDLLVFMEKAEISKVEVAEKLKKSKAYISQVLSGSRNMTLGTLSDVCFAIGAQIEINVFDAEEELLQEDDAQPDFIIEKAHWNLHHFKANRNQAQKQKVWHDCDILPFKAA